MSTAPTPGSTVTRPGRLLSLDTARGITIAFMILVNNNGDWQHSYWVLKHARWNGWTPTDLVFPTFLFLVGVSIVFAFESKLARGVARATLLGHAAKRAVVLFLFGLLVNGFPLFHLHTLRIYGVLQRIALCYLLASMLYLFTRRLAVHVGVILAALVGYWLLMRYVPVPGYGTPTVQIPLLDPDANWVAYVDRHLLFGRLYEGTRDPEGLLSTIPALATTLLGVLCGRWLRSARPLAQRFTGLLVSSLVLLLAGRLWGQFFPINKKLWTSSYVLWTAGCSLLLLALCYWAVEIRGWKRGWTWPWLVFGSNAIAAYLFSELLAPLLSTLRLHGHSLQRVIYEGSFAHVPNPEFASLLYALAFVVVCFIPIWLLYRKGIFLKV